MAMTKIVEIQGNLELDFQLIPESQSSDATAGTVGSGAAGGAAKEAPVQKAAPLRAQEDSAPQHAPQPAEDDKCSPCPGCRDEDASLKGCKKAAR